MKNNKYSLIIGVLILVGIGYWLWARPTQAPVQDQASDSSMQQTFTGVVKGFDTGCYADAECSITVDNIKVITNIGWNRELTGDVDGFEFGDDSVIGKQVEVYAKPVNAKVYTLIGSEDYYVKLIK